MESLIKRVVTSRLMFEELILKRYPLELIEITDEDLKKELLKESEKAFNLLNHETLFSGAEKSSSDDIAILYLYMYNNKFDSYSHHEEYQKLLLSFNQDNPTILTLKALEAKRVKAYKEASSFLKEAIILKDAAANYEFGKMIQDNLLPDYSWEESFDYFDEASKLNDIRGIMEVGFSYYHGNKIKQSTKIALEYFLKAAQMGYYEAYFTVANIYDNDKNDKKEAFNYYMKAAEAKLPDAYYEIGKRYFFASGVERNYEEALSYFRLAAEAHNPLAYYAIGHAMELGLGISIDIKGAIEYYKIAYQISGHLGAKRRLDKLHVKL